MRSSGNIIMRVCVYIYIYIECICIYKIYIYKIYSTIYRHVFAHQCILVQSGYGMATIFYIYIYIF